MTAPGIRFTFTDRHLFYEMITGLVHGQDETVGVVTSGLLIVVIMLIRTGFFDGFLFPFAVLHVTPGVRLFAAEGGIGHMHLGGVLRNDDAVQGITGVLIPVGTRSGVGRTILVTYRLSIADRQVLCDLHLRQYLQIQTIDRMTAIGLLFHVGIDMCLTT